MIFHGFLTVLVFASAIIFPWPLTAVLAVTAAFFEPLIPLAAGLFMDAVYYAPASGTLPLFALSGLVLTVAILLVQRRLRVGTMSK